MFTSKHFPPFAPWAFHLSIGSVFLKGRDRSQRRNVQVFWTGLAKLPALSLMRFIFALLFSSFLGGTLSEHFLPPSLVHCVLKLEMCF